MADRFTEDIVDCADCFEVAQTNGTWRRILWRRDVVPGVAAWAAIGLLWGSLSFAGPVYLALGLPLWLLPIFVGPSIRRARGAATADEHGLQLGGKRVLFSEIAEVDVAETYDATHNQGFRHPGVILRKADGTCFALRMALPEAQAWASRIGNAIAAQAGEPPQKLNQLRSPSTASGLPEQ